MIGYDARLTYCSTRGDDLSSDPLSWEATTKLMKSGRKTLHRLIDLVFKLTAESFNTGQFPSRDDGPWDKLIRI